MPKPINEDTLVGDVLQEWTIQEYEQHERGKLWYLIMSFLGIALIFYALISGNFLFALIIILFAIILFLQHNQEPKQILFQLTELGIILGKKYYSYSEFEDFYIIYNPPEIKTLYLKPQSMLKPLLRIPLLDMNPVEIKHTLREFLSENIEEEDEPLSDKLARNWKLH